ncbi:MAG: malate synthase [Olpidium bornovanus]|uniref:Malate synthase n=1 Tax=Olpidium bornovanus TaxID=278681 RepID=A0A8H8DLX1_9FUNG|nr:MAG: malate synthase [Olpidium bornovanus]
MPAEKTTLTANVAGVRVLGKVAREEAEILAPDALRFLAVLQRKFDPVRARLLQKRALRQQELDRGLLPDFLPETARVRESDAWKGAPPAPGLADRRVEITGPVDRKMVINALNSGARTFMADFEDSTAPTWDNIISGQVNMRDAVNRTIAYTNPMNAKEYRLRSDGKVATLLVRYCVTNADVDRIIINGFYSCTT